MKIFWITNLLLNILFAKEYHCAEHSTYLSQTEYGYEHINHKIFLNKSTLISELSDNYWFIENISCTKNGFKVVGSHRQYNDLKKKIFIIIPINNTTYTLKEI